MLWCKSTFNARYGDDVCRVFPTQQQLFEFIDAVKDQAGGDGVSDTWLPFGIEFPSEEELARELPLRALRAAAVVVGRGGASEGDRLLFRKRPRPPRRVEDEPCDPRRQQGGLLDDYAVLYGATPLSSQTRMFLAATIEGVAQVVRDIEPLQLHLYELIREGSHCHMYLDVERDRDYSSWRAVVRVTDDSNTDSEADLEEKKEVEGDTVEYECHRVEEYVAALATAVWKPPRCCRWDCKLRSGNGATTAVLLAELQTFLRSAYPALVGASSDEDETSSALLLLLPERPLGAGVDVMVMRSVEQGSHGRESADGKFSQHYVVYFDGQWFNSNDDVGRLVRQFVDYLYERAVVAPHVHTALFYHDMPRDFPVLPTGSSSPNLPFLPLRCVIDTAVYSRNRMLRCLGSCKLHKSSVLVVERRPTALTKMNDPVGLFFASLVCLQVGHRAVINVPLAPPPPPPAAAAAGGGGGGGGGAKVPQGGDLRGLRGGERGGGGMTPRLLLGAEAERYRMLAEHVASEWSAVGGVACRVHSIRLFGGGRYVLFLLEGSRFCGNVGRQHRSNRVYISADLQERVWVQKCFDPDCATYKSATREIHGALLRDAHSWTGETRAAALASHESLRTPFRPKLH